MSSMRFAPCIPAETDLPEFTLEAMVLGILMSLGPCGVEAGILLRLTAASPILGSPFDSGMRRVPRRLM